MITNPMDLFQHVRSTSYLLKAFGILHMLIQSGHKYCVLCGCVCVCIHHLSSNIPDRGLYVWAEIVDSLCVAVCCVGVVCLCSISPQTFETGVFMFELRSRIVCVWLCAVWVCVCMFNLSSSIRDRGLYVWAEILDSLCVAVCCVGVCVRVPSQLKHSRQGSLCLSWAGQRPVCVASCPNPSHSVPTL